MSRRSRAASAESQEQRASLMRLVSLLLQYPDAELLAARPQLAEFTAWFADAEPMGLALDYVDTFDLRRKCSLYLTYYLHGDTRRRGMAMLSLKHRYRVAGLTPPEGELPDYLPVVCEFAAIAGPGDGEAPFRQHRKGLDLIRAGLRGRGSRYALVLDALCAVLPALSEEELGGVSDLALAGPPVELVGLAAGLPGYAAVTGDDGANAGREGRR